MRGAAPASEPRTSCPAALLLYPKITDPTSPYHSLVYLATHAKKYGYHNVEIRDTNIEALNYCARPDVMARLIRAWDGRRRRLSSRASLTRLEQLEYLHLLSIGLLEPDSPSAAIADLRNPETFYDF